MTPTPSHEPRSASWLPGFQFQNRKPPRHDAASAKRTLPALRDCATRRRRRQEPHSLRNAPSERRPHTRHPCIHPGPAPRADARARAEKRVHIPCPGDAARCAVRRRQAVGDDSGSARSRRETAAHAMAQRSERFRTLLRQLRDLERRDSGEGGGGGIPKREALPREPLHFQPRRQRQRELREPRGI